MQKNFVAPNDPILIQIAEKVTSDELNSPEGENIIQIMLETAYGEQKDSQKPIMVGLAAPQLGIAKRIILVDIAASGRGDVGDLRIYINPEIIWKSNETNEWYEGCYSTDRVCGIVSRPTKIRIRALNREGKLIEEKHEGYTARIFQHEIDHLNGKVFIDHITDDDKLHWVEKNEFPLYRNNEGWRTWTKKCSREKWEEIRERDK